MKRNHNSEQGLSPEDFHMPAEWERHEGTWLQWPHDDQWRGYQLKLENIWLHLVSNLHEHEKVHICVQDTRRKEHIEHQLEFFGIGFKNISFHIIPTNDVWSRDNGPTFVINKKGEIAIVNWKFNGWGNRYRYNLDNLVPERISKELNIPIFHAPLTLEGGAIDVNGKGILMATRSALINSNRNPGMTQKEIEEILKRYLGIEHFIWLTGMKTESLTIGWADDTDTHIDTVARFVNDNTVLYAWAEKTDPRYPLLKKCYEELKNATKELDEPLNLIPLPLPKNGVYSTSRIGEGGGIMKSAKPLVTDASYTNFYIANDIVLVPVFGNINDEHALEIISQQFPHRKIIGINCVSLIENGGSIHCVTQQQPAPP